jgi:hypothetical protein
LQRSSILGKQPATADKGSDSTQAKTAQLQQQLAGATKAAAAAADEADEPGALPLNLKTGQHKQQGKYVTTNAEDDSSIHGILWHSTCRKAAMLLLCMHASQASANSCLHCCGFPSISAFICNQVLLLSSVGASLFAAVSAPTAWSPCSGETPSKWLEAAHGPLWQAQAAAAARQAAAANRHVLGQLEQRRAALLKASQNSLPCGTEVACQATAFCHRLCVRLCMLVPTACPSLLAHRRN